MIGWLIVLGILALLLGLLLSPLVFALDYDDPKDRFFWKLSWLGIPLLSSEASIAFEQYQTAVQCRNSAVLEQAYASGYRTAVQMFAAGLGPQPPIPEHEEDSNG